MDSGPPGPAPGAWPILPSESSSGNPISEWCRRGSCLRSGTRRIAAGRRAPCAPEAKQSITQRIQHQSAAAI